MIEQKPSFTIKEKEDAKFGCTDYNVVDIKDGSERVVISASYYPYRSSDTREGNYYFIQWRNNIDPEIFIRNVDNLVEELINNGVEPRYDKVDYTYRVGNQFGDIEDIKTERPLSVDAIPENHRSTVSVFLGIGTPFGRFERSKLSPKEELPAIIFGTHLDQPSSFKKFVENSISEPISVDTLDQLFNTISIRLTQQN